MEKVGATTSYIDFYGCSILIKAKFKAILSDLTVHYK